MGGSRKFLRDYYMGLICCLLCCIVMVGCRRKFGWEVSGEYFKGEVMRSMNSIVDSDISDMDVYDFSGNLCEKLTEYGCTGLKSLSGYWDGYRYVLNVDCGSGGFYVVYVSGDLDILEIRSGSREGMILYKQG